MSQLPPAVNLPTLSDDDLLALVNAFSYAPALLQKADDLHWLATPDNRARVIHAAYVLLTPMLLNPLRALQGMATQTRLIYGGFAHKTTAGQLIGAKHLYGATEAAFTRNLAVYGLMLTLNEFIDYEYNIGPAITKQLRAVVQFAPAILLLFPTLFHTPAMYADIIENTPGLQHAINLVTTLYEAPLERYTALTALLEDAVVAAPGTTTLPSNMGMVSSS